MRDKVIRITRAIRKRKKKRLKRTLLPWLQSQIRAETKGGTNSAQLPTDSVIYRAKLARTINAMCGSSVFHAWNVAELPRLDIEEIEKYIDWSDKLRGHYSG